MSVQPQEASTRTRPPVQTAPNDRAGSEQQRDMTEYDDLIADLTRQVEQLQRALGTRVVIEQAKGALSRDLGIEVTAAFAVMRHFARNHNRRLHDLAADIVERRITARELVGLPSTISAA